MDYYMNDSSSGGSSTGRNHSLLSDTNDNLSSSSQSKHRFDSQFDSRDSSALDLPASSYDNSASSSSSSSSFLPLSATWQRRLFPATTAARILWLLIVGGVLFCLLLIGYEIGKSVARSSSNTPTPPSPHSIVLLVSIDGFRASYLNDYAPLIPTLKAMQYAGSYAKRMQSCFPSSTFPNHWSIVTGLYTEEHGITSNNMYDPTLDASFNMQTLDPVWWGGEPVWNTAIKQGLRANVMYWPGSEVPVQGMRPTVTFPFNDSTPNMDRVNTVLGWLTDRSCALCITYFSTLDTAGHNGGPNSTRVRDALPIIDSLISALITGIAARGLTNDVTLILTSDHGMSGISVNRSVSLSSYTDITQMRITDTGATLGIWPNDLSQSNIDRIYNELHGKIPNINLYQRSQIPVDFHYNKNIRIPPIVGMMYDGWVVSGARPYTTGTGGTHGYDPRYASMGALFLGVGKGLRRGGVLDDVDNVNVYSLLCHLLGIVPAKTSGSLEPWRSILVSESTSGMVDVSKAVTVNDSISS